MKHFKEDNSMHETLKTLTSSYVICVECFEVGNFPKILLREEFQKESLKSILELALPKPEKKEEGATRDVEMKPAEAEPSGSPTDWTQEEIELLVDGVVQYQNDWDKISKEVFNQLRSADHCVLKFLELPLTENMIGKINKGAIRENE